MRGGHDGAEDHDVALGAVAAHDTNNLIGVDSGVRLADLVVKARLTDRADEDVVRLPGHPHALSSNIAENPDSDTGAGEVVSL